MLRSLSTAVASLNLHQAWLDVISDNLANANTTGFKASRVVFQDQFAQLLSAGSAPSDTMGGVNPTQIGLGVQLGYVSPNFTQGTLQPTGRYNDLAIEGDGFFIYGSEAEQWYSREGSLQMDANGYLVNSSTGLRVLGWSADGGATSVDTNTPISSLQVPMDKTLAQATSNGYIGGNLNAETATNGTVDVTFGAYDTLGVLHDVSMRFTRTGDSAWSWAVTGPTGAAGSGTLTFDTDGQYDTSTVATAITIPGSTGAEAISLTLDLSNITMLASTSDVTLTSHDGLPPGSVTDVFAAPDTGEVYVVYSNGLKELAGQLALARFSNPTGLLRDGNNLFRAGLNSGVAQVGTAGTGGRGSIASGYLEASNVDMAQEFTNMILAQRGFQASTRVITTSDEILQELVNLKR